MKTTRIITIFVSIFMTAAFASAAVVKNNNRLKSPKLSRQTKITMQQARIIALAKAAGKIESEELEKEHGKTVYSFDIRNSAGTITEVQIDAYTGAIVSVEIENAKQEAAEKRKDKTSKKQQDDDDDENPAAKNSRMAKLAREARITMAQAREIALKKNPGTITEEDLEKEKGRIQYSFDIKTSDGKVFDVEIDAKSGAILKVVEDTEDKDDDN